MRRSVDPHTGFYATVDKAVGLEGEPRIIITFNGKFLPYTEQKVGRAGSRLLLGAASP
jgi:cyanate lyase